MASATGFIRSQGSAVSPVSGDGELVAAARSGSAEAITALVRRHWQSVYRAAYLILHDAAAAEDVAQESMLAAIDALDRFDDTRALAPWLHRIAVNNSLKWLRAAPRRHEISTEAIDLRGERTGVAPRREISDELLAALAELETSQRAVVVLRYLLDCTPGEIAKTLDVPRGTVNSRLRRALDRLGESIGEEIP